MIAAVLLLQYKALIHMLQFTHGTIDKQRLLCDCVLLPVPVVSKGC